MYLVEAQMALPGVPQRSPEMSGQGPVKVSAAVHHRSECRWAVAAGFFLENSYRSAQTLSATLVALVTTPRKAAAVALAVWQAIAEPRPEDVAPTQVEAPRTTVLD